MKRIKIFSLILGILTLIAGCLDSPVAPKEYQIEGKIYPFGLLSNGYLVSIGNYPIVSTASDGSFKISTNNLPCELVVTDFDFLINYSTYVLKFNSITTGNLNIYYYANPLDIEYYPNNCRIIVYFPEFTGIKNITCKFVSDKLFSQNTEPAIEKEGVDSIIINIKVPSYNEPVKGKLIFFEASIDENNNITSYEKFGFKEITLQTSQNIKFENSELTDPGEAFISTQININEEFSYYHSNVSLSIDMGGIENDIKIKNIMYSNDYAIIPLIKEIDYRIKLHSYFRNDIAELGNAYITEKPGNNLILNAPQTVKILLPENNSVNITDSSTFEINDEEQNAVYEYIFLRGNELKFYTTKKLLKFSEFKTRMFNIYPDNIYYWCVKKYPGYSSIDQLLSENYTKVPAEVTTVKSFTTAP